MSRLHICPRKEKSAATRFDGAIEELRLPEAWDAASEMPVVTLPRALRLTMLLAKDGHPRFDPAARRFLERFLREEKPLIEQTFKTVDGLHELHRASPLLEMHAWEGLHNLADQIERRRLLLPK